MPTIADFRVPPGGDTGVVPRKQPRAFFEEKPDWFQEGIQKIRVEEATGRAAGYITQWGECLLNGDEDDCWQAPPSKSNYAIFHQGDYETAEGDWIKTGVIGGSGDHAPVSASIDQAHEYYAKAETQMMVGCIYEDDYGPFFLGTIVPEVKRAGIDWINRSALSGDWRHYHKVGDYDCVGPWLVSRPGFPLDRRGLSRNERSNFVRLASADGGHPVFLSSIGGTTNMSTTKSSPPERLKHQGVLYRRVRSAPRRAAIEDAPNAEPLFDGPTEDEGGSESARLDALESRLDALEAEVASMVDGGADVMPLEALPV